MRASRETPATAEYQTAWRQSVERRSTTIAPSELIVKYGPIRPTVTAGSSAATFATDVFSGTAAALVRGGVSAVVAMQFEISDGAAIAFSRGFYGAIAHGRGVDEAVRSGRVAILGLGDSLEWITPTLHLRGLPG